MEFQQLQNANDQEIVLTVNEHSPDVFMAMIKFLYLGESQINSNELVDLLQLCQEYLLAGMKQAIEHIFAEQLTLDLFVDVYMLTKAFDCSYLKDRVMSFGRANRAELRNRGFLSQIDKDDMLAIMSKNSNA